MGKIALFAGSFDPFTLGHDSIVRRTLEFTDQVVIGIGKNEGKHMMFTPEGRKEMISAIYEGNDRVRVEIYNGLTTDFASEIGACMLVRGIRTIADFEYERGLADINRRLTGIETVLLITEHQLSYISSTAVRELIRYGKDVSQFLPEGMNIDLKP